MKKVEITELCYADNMVLIAKDKNTLTINIVLYENVLKEINISVENTKTMILITKFRTRKL